MDGIPKSQLTVVKEFEDSIRMSFRAADASLGLGTSTVLEDDDAEDHRPHNMRLVTNTIRNNNTTSTSHELEEARDTITANESKGVNILKTVMYMTLVFSAGTIGIATLWFLQDERLRLLGLELDGIGGEAASKVQGYLDGIASQLFQLSGAYSSEYIYQSTITSSATNNNTSTIPLLTLPHFDQRVKNNPKSSLVFYTPIIPADGSKEEWTAYAIRNQGWIQEALDERGWTPITSWISGQVYSYEDAGQTESNMLAPIWQLSPVPRNRSIVNLNVMTVPVLSSLWQETSTNNNNNSTNNNQARISQAMDTTFFREFAMETNNLAPESFLSTPVYKTFDYYSDKNNNENPFGYLFGLVSWQTAISIAFAECKFDLEVQIQELCGNDNNEQAIRFLVKDGGTTTYQLPTDPLSKYIDDTFKEEYDLELLLYGGCDYHLTVHALEGAQELVEREIPILGFLMAGFLLIFLVVVFYWYNRVVKERQVKLLATAKRSNAVVSSLFPEAVQNRLMEEVVEKQKNFKPESRRQFLKKTGSKNFKKDELDAVSEQVRAAPAKRGKAIADFFPETTIMFADIVGFTAWSSMREPTQVFELLESIYSCFDEIARKRRVFKVETIGDCYVAVVGLPEPCEDHAIVMARFAHDCRTKMNETVKQLEVTLGPDTADLCMRTGLHSGPVTAGVLRGDKARFQLFGDTMNTTSRIETTGKPNRIHLSEQCAQYLMAAGKKHWLLLREDKVTAKGKGELTTYWLRIGRATRGRRNELATEASTLTNDEDDIGVEPVSEAPQTKGGISEKEQRLVDWITNELERFLYRVVAKRNVVHGYDDSPDALTELEQESLRNLADKTPMDEFKEIIEFPAYDADLTDFLMVSKRDADNHIDETVKKELHDYIKSIACMYKPNMFHNFEHASHVTMSVAKLISRIVAPGHETDVNDSAMKLHESTFGLASDPLTQFSMALASLIHDVDHPGVPNSRLIQENHPLAGRYQQKSMHEQNALDKSWRLLLDPKYTNLRRTIYKSTSEFQRFRQVLVNTVISTDILDKTFIERQKERWNMAFNKEQQEEEPASMMNRKATIVIEHIIQASDIAHTMQHWHVYRKWNGRLFEEMYKAFQNKRADKSPSNGWYQGEMDFFDNYVIPMAQKLKDCGIFGVSSDELLTYAQQNRQEWTLDGKKHVQSMMKALKMEGDGGRIRGVSRNTSLDFGRGSGGSTKASLSPPPPEGARPRKPNRSMSVPENLDVAPVPVVSEVPKELNNKNALLETASIELTLNDENDAMSQHSEQSGDSYARKGKHLKLPEVLQVLIVDDDNLNRILFTRAIMSLAPKWIVSEAESVEEAMGIIDNTKTPFDVIFMDHYAGSIVGDFLGSSAVKLLRIKGVNSLICAMSPRDKEVMIDTMDGEAFGHTTTLFDPKALLAEVNKVMYESGQFNDSW